MTRLMNISRTKQERSFSGSGSPIVASSLSRCARPWFESQRTRYDKLTQSRSGQPPKEMREYQAESPRPEELVDISRAWTETDNMEISMRSTDTTLQPQQITSPTTASGHSVVDQQVMDQFTQFRSMLSLFLRQKQETATQGSRRDSNTREWKRNTFRHLEMSL